MGLCSSCLGRDDPTHEPDETSQLLYDDDNGNGNDNDCNSALTQHYGTIAGSDQNIVLDPEDLKRQDEALARICSDAQNELVDILHHDSPGDAPAGSQYTTLINRLLVARDEPRTQNPTLTNGSLSNGTFSQTVGPQSAGSNEQTHGLTHARGGQDQPDDHTCDDEDEAEWLKAAQTGLAAEIDTTGLDASGFAVELDASKTDGFTSQGRNRGFEIG